MIKFWCFSWYLNHICTICVNNVANFGVFELGHCEVLWFSWCVDVKHIVSQSSSDASLVFLHDWIGTWEQRAYWNFYHLIVYVPRWQVSTFSWMALFPRCLGRSLYSFVFGVYESWSKSHKVLASSFWNFMSNFEVWSWKLGGRWHTILRRVVCFFNAWFKHYLEMPKNW